MLLQDDGSVISSRYYNTTGPWMRNETTAFTQPRFSVSYGETNSTAKLKLIGSSSEYRLLFLHEPSTDYLSYHHKKNHRTFYLLDLATQKPIKCYMPQKLMNLVQNPTLSFYVFKPQEHADRNKMQAFVVIRQHNVVQHLAYVDLCSGSYFELNFDTLKKKLYSKSSSSQFQFTLKHCIDFHCFTDQKNH